MKLTPSIFSLSLLMFGFIGCSILALIFLLTGLFSIEAESLHLGIFALLLSLGNLFLNWLLWKSIKDKVQFISLDNSTFKIFRPLSGKRIEVKTSSIRGYSKSLNDKSYGSAILKKNCLTIYFVDGFAPVEFVQCQIKNLKEFEEELNRLKIDFLGTEEICRDGFGQRTKFAYER